MSPAQEQSILPANHKMHAGQGKSLDTLQGSIAFCLISAATKNNGVKIIYTQTKKIKNQIKSKTEKQTNPSPYTFPQRYNVNAI